MAREAGPPPARIAVEAALLALEPAWTIRAGWQWGEPPDDAASDYLLLHVRKGIALIDAGGSRGDGGAVLARFLEHQGFSSFFPGTLPIVEVVAATAGPVALAERLDEAFAAAPALTITEPDWAAAARMLVAAAQAPEPPALPRRPAPEPAAEPHFAAPAWTAAPAAPRPPAPEPEPVLAAPKRQRRQRRQRRWPMAVAVAMVALAGAAGAWMELGSRTAPVAKLEVALPPSATTDKVAAAPPQPAPSPPPAVEGNDVPTPPSPLEDTPPPPVPPARAALPPLPARKPVPARAVVRPAAARPREAPRPITRLVAAMPIAAARRDCRAYSAPLTVLGRREAVTGIACRGPDGTWQLVSEAPR